MKVSVIIPTWNRKDNIIKVLKCLEHQVIKPQHTMQIIVIDDCSNDGTLDAINEWITNRKESLTFHLLRREERGVWNASIPRNMGVKLADKDTEGFLFLDSDVMLPPDRIQRLIDIWLEDPDPMRVIIGPYHYMQIPIEWEPEWWMRRIEHYSRDIRWRTFQDYDESIKETGIGFALACFGGNLFVPRDLFFKAGGYDEEMLSGVEDGEFGLRLARTGAVFSMDEGLLGWHHPHEIHPERTQFINQCVKKINMRYFGSEVPNYGLVEASTEAYKQWQIDWIPPESWVKENEG